MEKMRYKRWTEEDDDYLISFSMDPEGEDTQEVADYLGRSRNAVKSRLQRLRKVNKQVKCLERKWTERENSILIHAKRNMTYKEIGELLNRTEASVTIHAQRLGISKPITSTETLNQLEGTIRKLAKEGYTRREIAEAVNLKYTVIKHFIYTRKIECVNAPNVRTDKQREAHRNFMIKAIRRST